MGLTLTMQGWFYVITGIWPVLHMQSFEMVTGTKTDKWLVKTMGLMILCSGIIFIGFTEAKATYMLALLNALTLGMVDVYYVTKKVVAKVYLLDAVIEFVFVGLYLYGWK